MYHKLCRITQSSSVHRTESVSVMDHERTMGVSSTVLDRKQQNIFDQISLFWSVELQGHLAQQSGGDHGWLIQIWVSTVQRGMLVQTELTSSSKQVATYSNACMTPVFLASYFITGRISVEVMQSPSSVRPYVFYSIFGTDRPLTLNFCK